MNAGLASGEWNQTPADGWERTLQVNVLSTSLLSLRLLPLLIKSGSTTPHLVIVASDVHVGAKFAERNDPNILQSLNDKTEWQKSQQLGGVIERYAVTKLFNIYMTVEMAEMVSKRQTPPAVIVNCVTPGFCKSELLTREKAPFLLKAVQWLVARDVAEGGKALVDAAVRGPESHGKWLENQKIAE
jgi:NAD(P)-dependent dehydrogenase (short-subunit alcohol dehydrogenase family)